MAEANQSFNEFLADAPPGSKFVYHVGLLMNDRQALEPWSQKWGHTPLHYFAKRIYDAYEEGKVLLVQEKRRELGNGTYIYYAVKRRYRARANGPYARGHELFGSFSGPRSSRGPFNRRGPFSPNTDRAG